MYYKILCRGKFGDTSSNQKMNRQYKKKAKDKIFVDKTECRKIKTKVIRTPSNTIGELGSS